MNEIITARAPSPRLPRFQLPVGTVDSHIHVFGPVERYPYAESRAFTPDDALPVSAEAIFRNAGVGRAVLVQPSVYGTDNRRHLAAAAEMSVPTKVVVAIETEAPEHDLAVMDAGGARGVRRILPPQLDSDAVSDIERLASRLSELGWHLQLLARPEHLGALETTLARLPATVVFDHLALVDAAAGVSQPGFQALLRLLQTGRSYVKISGFYRLSKLVAPYADLKPFVRAVVQAAPDRCVWGSDWPHPAFSGPLPAYDDLVDPLLEWIPDDRVRQQVLVTNPSALYGFEPIGQS